MAKPETIIETQGLKKHFPVAKSFILTRVSGWIKAVDGLNLTIATNRTLGLVGESGCGKTTTAKLILLMEKPTSGSILFHGQTDTSNIKGSNLRRYRNSVQALFQDPYGSLNPRMRIGAIVAEPLEVNLALSRNELKERVKILLKDVGLDSDVLDRYPHEFSGGQRQRIALARSLALNPELVILDEPVSALDVSIRAAIINLLMDLQEKFGLAYLLIAHNLATVRTMSDEVAVMYLGKIVEHAAGEELYTRPCHPYTQALLSAALPSHPDMARKDVSLSGEVPSPLNPPGGCRFHPRCPKAKGICSTDEPILKWVNALHRVSCHFC